MTIEMNDQSGQPRSNQDLIDARDMIKKELIAGKIIPHMTIHFPVIIEAINELIISRKIIEVDPYKHYLQNMLAIIHKDGGHYTKAHGLKKSVGDAMSLVAELRMEIDRLQTLLLESS